jgi:hypothetical protein
LNNSSLSIVMLICSWPIAPAWTVVAWWAHGVQLAGRCCGYLFLSVECKVGALSRRSLDPSLFPIYSEKAIFGRHRVFQLAAGDPADSLPSGGRLGGGRTGNPWIPVGF